MTTDNNERHVSWAVGCGFALFAVFAFGAFAVRFFPYMMDDSYITFRYASNLAAGHGLVFNPEELPRAEGITSPLYAVVLSLAPLSGIDVISFAKWLGICASVLTSLLIGGTTYTVIRSVTSLHRPTAIMVGSSGLAYFLSNPYVVGNAVSGMETALGAMAFGVFLFLVFRVIVFKPPAAWASAFALGLSATLVPMLRPEMGLSVVLVFSSISLLISDTRITVLRSLAVFLVLGGLYCCWRFLYYGLPLPLPFYVKQSGFGLHGMSEVESYLAHSVVLLPLVLVCFAFAVGPNYADRKPSCAYLLATLTAVGGQLAYYATIHHIMGFGFRYFQPIAVAIIILAFVGGGLLYDAAGRSSLKSSFSLPLLFCVLIMLSIGSNLQAYRPARALLIDWYAAGIPESLEIALAMKTASKGQVFRIALNDCGIIPFYSGFSTIDLAGLNNRTIALAGTPEAARSEIREKQPHLVILATKEKHNPYALHGWENLSHDDVIQLGYDYVGMMKENRSMINGDGYHLLVYANQEPEVLVFLDELAQIGVLNRRQSEDRPEENSDPT